MTPTLRIRLSRLLFDDALTCGAYTLVYAPCDVGSDYAAFTLYWRDTYVTRWRVKTWQRLDAVRGQVAGGLAWACGEWDFVEGGGFAFVADEPLEQLELFVMAA